MYVNKFPDVFELPDRKATIWRYMGLAKFASLLEQRALFFCRSDLFDDRFEGSYPKGAAIEDALPKIDQASRFSGSVPGSYGYSTKKEWTHAASANWTRIMDPSTVAVFQFTFRNEPFKNIPSGGDSSFGVPIVNLNPKPPFAGPPAILINSNGLGISDLFDRLLFNYSADYGYTFDPSITRTIGNHTLKAGFTRLDLGAARAVPAVPKDVHYSAELVATVRTLQFSLPATSLEVEVRHRRQLGAMRSAHQGSLSIARSRHTAALGLFKTAQPLLWHESILAVLACLPKLFPRAHHPCLGLDGGWA